MCGTRTTVLPKSTSRFTSSSGASSAPSKIYSTSCSAPRTATKTKTMTMPRRIRSTEFSTVSFSHGSSQVRMSAPWLIDFLLSRGQNFVVPSLRDTQVESDLSCAIRCPLQLNAHSESCCVTSCLCILGRRKQLTFLIVGLPNCHAHAWFACCFALPVQPQFSLIPIFRYFVRRVP